MKLIFCYWDNLIDPKLTQAFEDMGHNVLPFNREFNDKDYDTDYLTALITFVKEHPDISFVISINYIPIISRACDYLNIPYISWLCDCPCYSLYSNTVPNKNNRIFFFDRMHAERFKNIYPQAHIYYLPAASDIALLDTLTISDEEYSLYNSDVSFVGSLYTEKGTHEQISKTLPPYLMVYVDGIINAQLNVYGYNFMEDSLSDDFVKDFKKHMNWQLPPDYTDDAKSVIADYYFGYRSTMLDRIHTLRTVSEHFNTDLYTTSDTSMLPAIHNRGIADTKTMLPKIYHCSKINLEITSKTFKSGMTQRLFDILAVGGFVISNYQSEIPEYFTPGKDLVLYESIPDLLDKIDYYLTHEEERRQIAENGLITVRKNHNYQTRINEAASILLKQPRNEHA